MHKTLLTALFPIILFANNPDWSQDAKLPGATRCETFARKQICFKNGNRSNIYNWQDKELDKKIDAGARHALYYPVKITGSRIPTNSLEKFFKADAKSPLKRFIYRITKKMSPYKSMDEIYTWLGLHEYPKNPKETGINYIPSMGKKIEQDPMGVTLYPGAHDLKSLTFSCAACHSSNLFGTKVLGMSNRFPRANHLFVQAKSIVKKTPLFLYKQFLNPTPSEYKEFARTKENLNYVGTTKPVALGLDTSLAQVGLSLAMRGPGPYAEKEKKYYKRPRKNKLTQVPADSKPAVWWNLKYKTRWLSDGSVVSGNPIYTNFLWNEIGRGTDLKVLEEWLVNNQDIIKELTSYVFQTKAPQYDNYFPNKINIKKARLGQKHFMNRCAKCHGIYDKGWDNPSTSTYKEKIATTEIWYHEQTPIKNVGTDKYRREGMNYFAADLNRLKISKTIETVVTPQRGYVPPPLVGIWSRWPYFHNNSAPTLYDVISGEETRTKSYIAVEAMDKNLDFDQIKNGYPPKNAVRKEFATDKEFYFDTKKKGMSNKGHALNITEDIDGNEYFSHEEKLELIEFLKTL